MVLRYRLVYYIMNSNAVLCPVEKQSASMDQGREKRFDGFRNYHDKKQKTDIQKHSEKGKKNPTRSRKFHGGV